jgi:hypothetical protein
MEWDISQPSKGFEICAKNTSCLESMMAEAVIVGAKQLIGLRRFY